MTAGNEPSFGKRVFFNWIFIMLAALLGYYWGEIHFLGHLFGH
jgi:hypothetical protein